jgi:methionyl aminopeptidase
MVIIPDSPQAGNPAGRVDDGMKTDWRMGINLKTPAEIELMRRAGRLVHEALRRCRLACKPGATTRQVDAEAEQVIAENPGSTPLFKWYPSYQKGKGFPAATCISVNDQIVHGIPGPRVLREGDLVSVDVGIRLDGWCADAATTVMVGQVGADKKRLCQVTEHVLGIAMENIRPGERWSRIAQKMQQYAERAGMGVIQDFVGHGIGRELHEEPKVPNFVSRELLRNDIELRCGMVLAVEPMCTLGSDRVRKLDDEWTIVTADGSDAAHYEHTIAVTETGGDVLTDGR